MLCWSRLGQSNTSLFVHLQAPLRSCCFSHQHSCTCCRYDQGVTAYIPCNKEWIKKKVSLTQITLATFCAFDFTDFHVDVAFLGCVSARCWQDCCPTQLV